ARPPPRCWRANPDSVVEPLDRTSGFPLVASSSASCGKPGLYPAHSGFTAAALAMGAIGNTDQNSFQDRQRTLLPKGRRSGKSESAMQGILAPVGSEAHTVVQRRS